MDARVSVEGGRDEQAEVFALRDWLTAEPEFRGRVGTAGRELRPDEMGGVVDVVTVALSNEGALTVLAGSVAVWLRQRRSTIKVKIVTEDGRTREISATGPAADVIAAKVEPDGL
ncbi:hypothetical protein [Actinosynnema sp. NPDC020468]|uniref:effector-associated constant component EACC1 n=1 Tax=Actinosynnema sp. NPDC020468 TaxID=3154488 RepID=UPI0033C0211B